MWLRPQRKTKDNEEGAETEETDALLDLLSCPHSPWHQDESWSPQAPALRQLAVLTPEPLHSDFIYNYFTTLRIVDKGVSVLIFFPAPKYYTLNLIQATHYPKMDIWVQNRTQKWITFSKFVWVNQWVMLLHDCEHLYLMFCLCCVQVSVIDDGLLKFLKLEELVLIANKISEIPGENLPSTLKVSHGPAPAFSAVKLYQSVAGVVMINCFSLSKILELRANRLSALNSLTSRPPPCLQYLGLGSNSLGSHRDVSHLTGRHWLVHTHVHRKSVDF